MRYSAVMIGVMLGCFQAPEPKPLPIAPPIAARQPSREELRTHWVQYYARQFGIDTALALRVSKAENTRGIRNAWSPTGCCVGVMQVNLAHYGEYDHECGGSDLMSYRNNACYGVLILRRYLRSTGGHLEAALWLYVGASTEEGRLEVEGYMMDILGD